MTKSEAIAAANFAVDKPVGRTGHWEVFGPYRAHDLDGDFTSIVRPTYGEALSARKEWVARIALVQMGYDLEDVQDALLRVCGRLEGMVSDAAKLMDAA